MSGGNLKIVNPADGSIVTELETDTPESIQENFECAARGQREWAKTTLGERKKILIRFDGLLQKGKEELAKILTSETGKPIRQSRGEIGAVSERIRFFTDNFEAVMRPETAHQAKGLEEKISFEPLGVIANISAWNYPYFVGANVFVPALLTGNAVLYKPSEYSTLTGLQIVKLMTRAGVPANAFIPVVGSGETGAEILRHPLAAVFFTGSHATGLKIAQAAAKRLMKVQLELGGKDPVYICEDVDVAAAAAAAAEGAFYNCGQSCCAIERLYVHEKIHSGFLDELLEAVQGMKVGDPTDPGTDIGPLTRARQIDVLKDQIEDAQKKGGKILCGGKPVSGKGNFFEPTVVSEASSVMSLMREESFGPVIGVQKVAGDEEALRLMNDTRFGLTAGVYTGDRKRAEKILSQADAGSVYWNCCDRVSPRLPWSGRKDSGLGLTLSRRGIAAFLQPKAWHLKN